MEILKQLEEDFNQALKKKDELAILILRQIKTAVANVEISKNRDKITEDELIKLIRSEVKKRKEATELYKQGDRQELADKEQKEIDFLSKYLPAEMSEDVIKQKISEVVTKVNAQGPSDIGKVMGVVMKDLSGAADGNVVSKLVKEALQ
ncbi:MAG: hypothetical protein CMI53_05215 [Parcubacteria group bacterium]|nr:hypothetical protein [Parcubacteria group bacterium]|tara:strand:- start:3343 stop:3789 length:447 start_codon:yes stop_codon:yes gene_type:complete